MDPSNPSHSTFQRCFLIAASMTYGDHIGVNATMTAMKVKKIDFVTALIPPTKRTRLARPAAIVTVGRKIW